LTRHWRSVAWLGGVEEKPVQSLSWCTGVL
jgi:hypothetical protein